MRSSIYGVLFSCLVITGQSLAATTVAIPMPPAKIGDTVPLHIEKECSIDIVTPLLHDILFQRDMGLTLPNSRTCTLGTSKVLSIAKPYRISNEMVLSVESSGFLLHSITFNMSGKSITSEESRSLWDILTTTPHVQLTQFKDYTIVDADNTAYVYNNNKRQWCSRGYLDKKDVGRTTSVTYWLHKNSTLIRLSKSGDKGPILKTSHRMGWLCEEKPALRLMLSPTLSPFPPGLK